MAYYQDIVTEYLRANRSVFLNTECCIQVNSSDNPDASGPHWYCDAVAVDLEERGAYLCETSYAKGLGTLVRRLRQWSTHWGEIREALRHDCHIPLDWNVRAWVFIPAECVTQAVAKIEGLGLGEGSGMPIPKITTLENTVPWKYHSWNRKDELPKPVAIPSTMR